MLHATGYWLRLFSTLESVLKMKEIKLVFLNYIESCVLV